MKEQAYLILILLSGTDRLESPNFGSHEADFETGARYNCHVLDGVYYDTAVAHQVLAYHRGRYPTRRFVLVVLNEEIPPLAETVEMTAKEPARMFRRVD